MFDVSNMLNLRVASLASANLAPEAMQAPAIDRKSSGPRQEKLRRVGVLNGTTEAEFRARYAAPGVTRFEDRS